VASLIEALKLRARCFFVAAVDEVDAAQVVVGAAQVVRAA
jgi:hypothetical protein